MDTPHTHRCPSCRQTIDHACIEQPCAADVRWVILCIRCYERLIDYEGAVI